MFPGCLIHTLPRFSQSGPFGFRKVSALSGLGLRWCDGKVNRLTLLLQARVEGVAARLHSPVRSTRLTVLLGTWLGPAFLICFGTGLFSHYLQEPGSITFFLTRPVWIYQVTQGIHITAGIASIPLLFAKLWSVFPELLRWPPIKNLWHALERASIALFVSSALVQLTIGLINTYKWYPWPFPFRQTHYWLAWIIVGSLALHIAVKLPLIRAHWRKRTGPDHEGPVRPAGRWSRRGFLTAVGLSSFTLVLTTAGQSFSWLAPFNLFAPRRMGTGPQSVPVNRTAAEAKVAVLARDPAWALQVRFRDQSAAYSVAQLGAMPLREHQLPIACVEGWSQYANWRGVPIRDLIATVGAPADSLLRITSLEPDGGYRIMTMPAAYTQDEQTLVALELNGEVLDLDHGYPARIIAPGRPGVLQTKWLKSIEVLG